MSPPVKPQVCVQAGRLLVFMGADYKALDRAAAKAFRRAVNGGYAKLLREEKQRRRRQEVARHE